MKRALGRFGIRSLLAAAVLGAVGVSAYAAGGDWPRWRGESFDGISQEKGLLKEWPQGGPPLAWKTTGLGTGYASVAISGGKLFTMGAEMRPPPADAGGNAGGGRRRPAASGVARLMAFDLQGKKLWSTEIGEAGGGGGYPGGRSTPTVDGNHVYALGPEGDLVCLAAADGKVIWSKNVSKEFGGKAGGWRYSESVLIDGDRVVCTPGGKDGTLLALNKKTGEKIWQTKDWTDSAHYSSIVIATIDGVRQYVQLTADSVAGVSPDDGKVLWKAARKGRTAVIPTPIVSGNHVFVTSGYGVGCDLFKVTKSASGAFDAAAVYTNDLNKGMANHHGGVILLDGKIYGYSDGGQGSDEKVEPSGWTCLDLETGKTVWRNKGVGKGTISYADGRFYIRSEGGAGTIALIEASPAGYKELGRFDQPDRSKANSWAHLVIADGKMYVRDQDVLLCYDIKAK
jgi:outer membrane protein assembly factor BamB